MSKTTTPAQAGTEKTRTRAPKQLTPADIVNQFTRLSLAEKLEVQKKIGACIEDDRQRLEEQLKLIQGNTSEPQQYDH